MNLSELLDFDRITVQAHDNPDADAIASGFALYRYFLSKNKKVSFIYSGRYQIRKTDIKLMIEKLNIPIEYRPVDAGRIKGLLVTVDCQYGAGNVFCFEADAVAVIDHHQQEIDACGIYAMEIASNLGSCSTLVWKMLSEEGFPIKEDIKLGTALYYGLFRDTNQFSELYYPLDMDMRETVRFDKTVIHQLRNSNLSLKELEIAGIALIRYAYNQDFHYAIIQTRPCDPNLLGIISDFIIQVDEIYTCVVFNHIEDGYKFSVRSCVKEVNASELAQFLAKDTGSGGGHLEKAGGFLSERRYDSLYPRIKAETYFGSKMNEYFESFDIVYIDETNVNIEGMKKYNSLKRKLGYVKTDSILPVGTRCFVRTLDGDSELIIDEGKYLIVDESGRVRIVEKAVFENDFAELGEVCDIKPEYAPRLREKASDRYIDLISLLKCCEPKSGGQVYAKRLERGIKVFTPRHDDSYLLGNEGDYIVVNCNDAANISILEESRFTRQYTAEK